MALSKSIWTRDVPINRLQSASAVLPIIGIGRYASDNNRYWPIISAGRLSANTYYYYLFIFRLDYWVIKSNRITKSYCVTHYSTTVLQSLHGNKFKLSLHFPVSKVYNRSRRIVGVTILRIGEKPLISISRLFGTDNRSTVFRPKRYQYISNLNTSDILLVYFINKNQFNHNKQAFINLKVNFAIFWLFE